MTTDGGYPPTGYRPGFGGASRPPGAGGSGTGDGPPWQAPSAPWPNAAVAAPAQVAVPSRTVRQPPPVRYAGFWRRAGGVFLDGIILGLVQLPVIFVLALTGREAATAAASCETFQRGSYVYERCTPNRTISNIFVALFFISQIWIYWRFIPRQQAYRGSTAGMRAFGIKVVSTDLRSLIGSGQAFLRGMFHSILILVFAVPAFSVFGLLGMSERFEYGLDGFEGGSSPVLEIAVFTFTGLLIGVPALWNLVDRRHQTLYDKMTKSVVILD